MSERKGFDLGDYVEVKDRIAILFELFPQARLVTSEVTMLTAPDDKQRVMVKALVYRTPDDPHPGVGHSWMEIPGTTSYTKGSELENAETSAWGRAIASLGILIDRSIASSNEIENKKGETPTEVPDADFDDGGDVETLTGRVSRRGVIKKGTGKTDNYKLVAHNGLEGHVIGFRLEIDGEQKAIPQCVVAGPLGEKLFLAYPDPTTLIGTVASVAGILYHVKGKKGASWYRLHVDRFENADWTLTNEAESDLPEPPDDVPLVGEAESKPLGLVS